MATLALPACQMKAEEGEHHHVHHKITAITPEVKNVEITQQYVCQIHSQRHIEVQALQSGYLEAIQIKEGQSVKAGDVMFRILPTLYQARLDAETAEVQLADLEFKNAQRLAEKNIVSEMEVRLQNARLAKAQAKLKLSQAELNFATVKAPFDGIINRLHRQQGSLVKEGDDLTTLSDNSTMWVYFNVPEARYLEYMEGKKQNKEDPPIELVMANGEKFPAKGKIGAIAADFNNQTGNIAFRADFPNDDRLLRHGQTGTIFIRQTLNDALVIPQRSTYETLDKQYVYVIDKDDVVHERGIKVKHELEDMFVLEKGLAAGERIVLEGVRQIHDGEKVHFENVTHEQLAKNLKFHAE